MYLYTYFFYLSLFRTRDQRRTRDDAVLSILIIIIIFFILFHLFIILNNVPPEIKENKDQIFYKQEKESVRKIDRQTDR